MCYVLYKEYTKRFITYSETGRVIHTSALGNAYKFNSLNQAKDAINKARKKTKLFLIYKVLENGELEKASNCKRKSFSMEERKRIYRKTKGHCYLCGEFVDFDKFEVEHNLPLGKGGTNDFDNLFPSCHICNTIKHDIYPEDFLERITSIFMYQMERKNSQSLKWKIVHRLLVKLI